MSPRHGAAKPACTVSADAAHHSPGAGTTGLSRRASPRQQNEFGWKVGQLLASKPSRTVG